MAINLTDGDEGLYDRLGALFQMVKDVEGFQTTLATQLGVIEDRFDSDLDLASGILGSLQSLQIQVGGVFTILSRTIERVLIEMVDDDNPLPSKDITTALEELIFQMVGAGTFAEGTVAPDDDVNANAVSIIDSADANNTGDGTVIRLILNNTLLDQMNVRPESIVLRCKTDSQEGAVQAGREIFSVKGEARVSDIRDINWPGGSGISSSLQVSDPSENAQKAAGHNILHNSDFEDWTVTDTPDNWVISVGAFGTDFVEEGTTVFRGTRSLELVGDGSTLPAMKQTFGTAGQTTGKLKPDTLYRIGFNFHGNASAVAGAVRVAVKDGADAILNGGNAAVSISTLTNASWTVQGVSFTTPKALPTGTKIVIEQTTAITSGQSVYIDNLILIEMPRFGGPGGPAIAIFPGQTDFVRGDLITLTVSNDNAGEFLHYFDMFYDTYSRGLLLPFDNGGTETLADTLIT